MGNILPFSLFDQNFKEYQMKCFYSLIEYVIHRDLSDVCKFSWNKEETLWFFLVWLRSKYQETNQFP